MDDSLLASEEADEPRTTVFRRRVEDGRRHLVGVDVIAETATVHLTVADATGLMIGRISGDIPAGSLAVAGELIGQAMSAAGLPSAPSPTKNSRYANQGARWTPDEEALLTARYAEGATIADLRTEFGRSANSIRARLVQLGHLPAEEWPAGLPSARHAA